MKSYQEYKEAGIKWINDVPKHWDVKPLFAIMSENKLSNRGNIEQNVLSLSYGKIIRRDLSENFGLLPASFETYQIIHPGYIVLRLTDLQNDWNSLRVGLVKEKGIITSAYVGLESSSLLNSTFAYYLLHAYDLVKVFYGEGAGVRQSITYKDLRRMPIIVPPLPEQQAIADFLDRKTAQISTLIEKKQQQIDLLQEQRTMLVNHVVTKGLNPNALMKDSGVRWLGEIPSHWDIARLRWLTKSVATGKTPPTIQQEYYENADINWFSPGDFNQHLILRESKKKINQLAINDGQPIYEKDTVLLIGIGGTLGKIGVLEEAGSSNQQINAISYNEKIYPLYGAYYLSTIKEAIVSQASFATLPILNQSQTKDLLHLIPPYDEQTKIIRYIQDKEKQLQNLITVQEKMIESYKEYRTALIFEAVTGKIDVRTVV